MSDHWAKTRRRAFAQLGGCCEICDSNKETEAHHNNYSNLGKEDPRRDLVILCNKCHSLLHSKISSSELGYNPGKKACSLCSLWPCYDRKGHPVEERKTRTYVSRRRLNICNLCYEVMKPHLITEKMSYAALRELRQRTARAANNRQIAPN